MSISHTIGQRHVLLLVVCFWLLVVLRENLHQTRIYIIESMVVESPRAIETAQVIRGEFPNSTNASNFSRVLERIENATTISVQEEEGSTKDPKKKETDIPTGTKDATVNAVAKVAQDEKLASQLAKWRIPNPKIHSPERIQVWETTTPWKNESTVGLIYSRFYSGYRNQVFALSALTMFAKVDGHNQILLDTLRHKDTFGTNAKLPHEYLFDVEHWNSFYPKLPRLVRCDPEIFNHYDCDKHEWKDMKNQFNTSSSEPSLPAQSKKQHHLFGAYSRFTQGRGGLTGIGPIPAETDLLIQRGALRIHPKLQEFVNRELVDPKTKKPLSYMTLHARVEPDMVAHDMPQCRDKKVTNLTHIFESLEREFPQPPVDRIFMPINRQVLEQGAYVKEGQEPNWIAVDNLKVLNHARDFGLWGGRAKVFEFGANAFVGTEYEKFKSIIGAMVNFHISQSSTIFVGTEISSYSTDIMRTRFYGGNRQNYKYLPDGLHRWTDDETEMPQGFSC